MLRPLFLLTDFGAGSHYVGVLHGVALRISSDLPVHDLTHGVRPGRVREGGYLLEASLPYLPDDAVVTCVVDPGVGTDRGIVLLQQGNRILVAPDNGLLTGCMAAGKTLNPCPEWISTPTLSRTFHGRDLFVPLAARLAMGELCIGDAVPLEDPVRLDGWDPEEKGGQLCGEVVHVDRFGNLITNLSGQLLEERGDGVLSVGATRIDVMHATFAEAPAGVPFVYEGSSGHLEVAVTRASAAVHLSARLGTAVLWASRPT